MRIDNIDLSTLICKGKVKTNHTEDGINLWSTNSITSIAFNLPGNKNNKHMLALPNKLRIPFSIDMRVKLDFPALILFVGEGHIFFSSLDNHKIEDIAKPSGKPNQDNGLIDNKLPLGEFVDISVTYDFDEMQILIGGEERFYSRKLPYMKEKKLVELNAEGFEIGLAVSKLSTLSIKSITVMEFDDKVTISGCNFERTPPPRIEVGNSKPTYENILVNLPQEYSNEMIETDKFLKSLHPLKFKRQIDKSGGKITYLASDYGISYIIQVFDHQLSHNLGWYIVTSGKAETWYRKADYMEEILTEIAESDMGLAQRMFYALNDCVGCYGSRCIVKTPYEFHGQKRLTCHGRVLLRMCHEDMQDVRDFFWILNGLMKKKIEDGSLQKEKMLLIKN